MNTILQNTAKNTHLWAGIIPLHLGGLVALALLFGGQAPDLWYVYALVGFFLMKIVGVGAGYHRYWSHRGFSMSRPMKLFVLYCGMLSAQGSPILWAGVHRGLHHRHSDQQGDPHSPQDGFWHSYILWMFRLPPQSVPVRSIVDLVRDPDISWGHKYYTQILWISYLIAGLISIDLLLWGLFLPALATLHVFCLQTSVVHYPWMGYRNYQTRDESVNCPWIWPLSMGESYHNNHHGDPKNPRYSRRWYEFDPTFWVIKLIGRV